MDTSGNLWLNNQSGSGIDYDGRAQSIYLDASSNTVKSDFSYINLGSTNGAIIAVNKTGSGTNGDLIIAHITDTTGFITYRITAQQTSNIPYEKYTIIIEQLAP